MVKDNSWLQKRGRGIHMTIRDIDCKDFDAERMAQDFEDMGVTFFSFFAGGYITTYPSSLRYSRRSPWLGDRDIAGDIVQAAHSHGIKAIAMADLSVLSPFAAAEHPEWVSVDRDGKPYEGVSGMYTACVMGDYGKEYGSAMVREILDRYDVDGIKFGGGSYGFHGSICHCESCRSDYDKTYHQPLPSRQDWEDPAWLQHHRWRTEKTSQRCRFLQDMVKSIRPDMPVMGNAVCFGAVDWTTNSALDIEDMAQYQDMVQIEAQDRAKVGTDLQPKWQSMAWTGEEACYMTSVTENKPIWIVVSYFKAWPWRRAAVDYAEQKAFMAQILANGASPMVNLSGGPPAVHEDTRGFKAPAELYLFMKKNIDYYDGDVSGATVALVYSQETLVYYGRSDKEARYLDGFRGFEKALQENQVPFDILSTKVLDAKHLSRYRVLVLPTLACMSEETAGALRSYVRQGGSIVATFETGLYDLSGTKREDYAIGDLLCAKYTGTLHVNGEKPEGRQNYYRLATGHELLEGLEGTGLVPAAGRCCVAESCEPAVVPLRLAAPFIVFPEGLSYTTEPDLGHPMMIAAEHPGGGRTVYLPGQIDRHHALAGFADLSRILSNSVAWAADHDLPVQVSGPNTLYVSLRRQSGRSLVHMVNLTGGQRYFRQMIPLIDIEVKIKKGLCGECVKAFLLSDRKPLEVRVVDGCHVVSVPRLIDYDVLVFEQESSNTGG